MLRVENLSSLPAVSAMFEMLTSFVSTQADSQVSYQL